MKVLEPTAENVALAAKAIRAGELVGMPTETVYGLAANALDPDAVQRIFVAKGRPSDNPLIVHVAGTELLAGIAEKPSGEAEALLRKFWPGPLTVVLRKGSSVPDIVTAGLSTVAVRSPAHLVAQALLVESRLPLAAPSANRFMGLSPTRASDLDPEIVSRTAMVLDGGECRVGIESTILDCTDSPFRLLRPGGLSREEIESVLGYGLEKADPAKGRQAPGMYPRHYAPSTPIRLAERLAVADAGICISMPSGPNQVQLPPDPAGFAARLYMALHDLDGKGFGELVVEAPPRTTDWEAVWDRLGKASRPAV